MKATVLVALVVAVGMPAGVSAGQRGAYAGRPVVEVLQELQKAGLRILFSSDLVPPTLRVKAEPKGEKPREIAVEILQPHGLTITPGPRGTLLVVARPGSAQPRQPPRRQPPAPDASSRRAGGDAQEQLAPVRIEEHVDVKDRLVERSLGSITYSVPPATVRETAGGFENVFQVFQLLPGAAAIDDDSGKLAVRGAGPEHNIVVLDGVQIHNPYRFSEMTSSFLNPRTAATVALDASGLDARYGGRLSSVTIIETRDGTRDRRLALSGSMSLANGDVLLEGRLPKTDSGSWWLTTRGTYYRPVVGLFRSGVLPSFADLQFKVAVRPTTRTRLSVFGMAGRELTHGDRSRPATELNGAEFTGRNTLGLVNFSWTPSSRLVSTTTVSMYAHDARDFDDIVGGEVPPFERESSVRDVAVRQHTTYAISPRHVLNAGVDVHRIRSAWHMAGLKPPLFWRGIGPSTGGEQIQYPATGAVDSRLARTQVGLWLQDRVPVGRRVSVEPGVRLDWNSYTREASWQPRLRLATGFAGAAIWAGFSAQTQAPSHESLQGFDYFHLPESGDALCNERSRQIVAGFERALGSALDLRVETYHRRFDRLLVQRLETAEERALRLSSYAIPPDMPPDSALLEQRPTIHPASTGRGTATGVEVLLQRNGERVSGWFGYTFSRTMREAYGYTFPFDFDRPHTVNAVANIRLSSRLRTAMTASHSSGFAITPAVNEVWFPPVWRPDGTREPVARPARRPDGTFLLSPDPALRRLSLRNSERLSSYSRVDVRVTYATRGRWEFYGEVINLFGNRNYRQTFPIPSLGGTLDPEATTDHDVYENFERFPTFGLRFTF